MTLLQKIRKGNFEYSRLFSKSNDIRNSAQLAYDTTYNNYAGMNQQNRLDAALDAGRKKRIKSIKLNLQAAEDERMILFNLRTQLKNHFGVDHWPLAIENIKGNGTTEDLYRWYEKQIK
tara:strand:+ start:445 stop:801 length:357 start_codon:yes stop_codon:yes gene_type:complete